MRAKKNAWEQEKVDVIWREKYKALRQKETALETEIIAQIKQNEQLNFDPMLIYVNLKNAEWPERKNELRLTLKEGASINEESKKFIRSFLNRIEKKD